MSYFDEKQKKLIKSWHELSSVSDDFYMKFMSEWIAFNAICYNLYYKKATIEPVKKGAEEINLADLAEALVEKIEEIRKDTELLVSFFQKKEIAFFTR